MDFAFQTESFVEKLRRLEAATKWFTELKLEYNVSRIGQYKRDINSLIDTLNQGKIEEISDTESSKRITNSLYEADELILIYERLFSIDNIDFIKSKLSHLLKGPANIENESKNSASHQARDYSFELMITALFNGTIYSLDFSTDADLVLKSKNYNLFLECKRPNSFNSLDTNIKKAASQLKKRYLINGFTDPKYGVIVLSIEKLVNPNQVYLIADDETKIDIKIKSSVRTFIEENQKYWKDIKESKTIGIIVFFKTIAIHKTRPMNVTCRFIATNNICNHSDVGINILYEVTKELKNSIGIQE